MHYEDKVLNPLDFIKIIGQPKGMTMKICFTDNPLRQDDECVINGLWDHNNEIDQVNLIPISLTVRNDNNEIQGGLIARTWWKGLDIQYLWLQEGIRGQGYGKRMMLMAEEIAKERNCRMAYVDTLSLQSKGFYENLGYAVYGSMEGFADRHTRFYLNKYFS